MPQRWIIIGDSLVTKAQPLGHAKESLTYHLMHRYDVNICLLASGGQTMTGQASQKLPKAVEFIDGPLKTVDKVIIALGTNDWAMDLFGRGISRQAYKDNYQTFLRALPRHLDIYAVTPLTRTDENSPNLCGAALEAYREDTRQVCQQAGVTVLDGSQIFETASPPYFIEDGVHLTAEGTSVYADWLWRQIMKPLV